MKQKKISYSTDRKEPLLQQDNPDIMGVSVVRCVESSAVSRTSWPHCVRAVTPPSLCELRPATPDSPDPAPQWLH